MFRKFTHIILALSFFAAVTISSCSKDETDNVITIEQSDTPISLGVKTVSTKANLFEKDSSIQNEGYIGGNCVVNAWINGKTDEKNQPIQYIRDARMWYFKDGDRWLFRDGNSEYECYWPKIDGTDGSIDIIAYFPWTRNPDNIKTQYHGITSINLNAMSEDGSATPSNPSIRFTCSMPHQANSNATDGSEQNNVTEFIYAFSKSKDINDQKLSGLIDLTFVHPLSAVSLKLKQAHRNLTIEKIDFINLYTEGSFESNLETSDIGNSNNETPTANTLSFTNWLPHETSDQPKGLTIKINKKIPEQLGFDEIIGGPYLVIPQSLGGKDNNNDTPDDNIKMVIYFNWEGNVTLGTNASGTTTTEKVEGNKYKSTIDLSKLTYSSGAAIWQPSKRYTYTLDLGDNKEEILFNVFVEEWKVPDAPTYIEIE